MAFALPVLLWLYSRSQQHHPSYRLATEVNLFGEVSFWTGCCPLAASAVAAWQISLVEVGAVTCRWSQASEMV